jgi:outer membrane protein
MSAKTLIVTSLVFAALTAQARDWADIVANPFVDPLLARPPVLDTGKLLPSDQEAAPCSASELFDATKPLSLADAVDLALCRSPQVQSAWASIKVQAAAVGEARAAYLPTFTAGVSRTRDRTRYPNSDFSETATVANSMYNTLSWRILDFGGRAANRQSANALLDAALASHDAALQKLLTTVIGAYFNAQTAKATLLAKQNSEAIAQQTLATAKRREEHGAGSQSDTLQATTALAKTRLDKSRAQGAYAKALSVLVYTLGLPVSTEYQRCYVDRRLN